MWKQFIDEYFTFSKKERTGIAVLISLVVIFTVLPVFYPHFIKVKKYDHTIFKQEIAALKIRQTDSSDQFSNQYKYPGKFNYQRTEAISGKNTAAFTGELFYFDPNTASAAEWKRLGIKDKTILTIQKYTAKGGKFYQPADIGKIWGIHPGQAERLIPFVQIRTAAASASPPYEKKAFEKPVFSIAMVDINDSDTSAWIALPGIGSKLSQRILNFRDKLGGFYSIDQVAETFGLQDSTFQKIKPKLRLSGSQVRQININTATVDELKMHPYLRYALANAIIQYRSQHGNFTAITDIRKIMTINEDVFNKVSPYLKVN